MSQPGLRVVVRETMSGVTVADLTGDLDAVSWWNAMNEVGEAAVQLLPGCCLDLSSVIPYGHTLVVSRNGADLFQGPVIRRVSTRGGGVLITAQNMLGWLQARVHRALVDCAAGCNAVDLVGALVVEALSRAGSPAYNLVKHPGGCTFVGATARGYTWDALTPIIGTTADIACWGNTVYTMCHSACLGELGAITEGMVSDDWALERRNTDMATSVDTKAATGPDVWVTAGGVDPVFGVLVERVDTAEGFTPITAPARAQSQIRNLPKLRTSIFDRSPITLDCPDDHFDVATMGPGQCTTLQLSGCELFGQTVRLARVGAEWSAGAGEKFQIVVEEVG